MLRFHRFTIGHFWVHEYGSPEEASDFKILRGYSPLHNVRKHGEHQLPPMIFTAADHDDRVVPLHTFKMVAELQHALGQAGAGGPVLVRIDSKAGHGHGTATSKLLNRTADLWTFVLKALNVTLPEQ